MRLHVRVTILEARRSQSKPDRGFIKHRIEGVDDAGQPVISILGMGMVRVRPV